MVAHFDENIEITCRAAAHACFAFASKTNACAGFNTRRNVDGQGFFFLDPTSAMAVVTRIFDCLTHAVTGRAGAFNGEETLLRAHFAHARTCRAGLGF